MSHNIIVESGKAFRLLTSGKYCDQDIIITAEGGKEDLDVVLTEQDNLIDELREVLKSKGSGEAEPVIEPLNVTENGTYSAPAGVNGYSPVTVNVPVPDGYIIPNGSKTITENGTHDVAEFASVEVNVEAGGGGGGGDLANALVEGYIEGDATFTASKIHYRAFEGVTCTGDLYFPNATEFGGNAFYSATANAIFAPKAEVVGSQEFRDAMVKRVELPQCTSAGDNLFYIGSVKATLETVLLPKLTKIPTSAFYYQEALVTVDVSSATHLYMGAFRGCEKLKILDLPSVESIDSNVFRGCSALVAVLLRKSAVCTLSYTNAFSSTPIASGTGYIYVPRALVDSYKTATNWSTYAAQFRALEDYTVDGTITGALDETKI